MPAMGRYCLGTSSPKRRPRPAATINTATRISGQLFQRDSITKLLFNMAWGDISRHRPIGYLASKRRYVGTPHPRRRPAMLRPPAREVTQWQSQCTWVRIRTAHDCRPFDCVARQYSCSGSSFPCKKAWCSDQLPPDQSTRCTAGSPGEPAQYLRLNGSHRATIQQCIGTSRARKIHILSARRQKPYTPERGS